MISNLYAGLRASCLRRLGVLWHLRQIVLVGVIADRAGHAGCSAPAPADRDGPRRPIGCCRIARRTRWHVNMDEQEVLRRKEISRGQTGGGVFCGMGSKHYRTHIPITAGTGAATLD